jgi:hypothetical protein
MASTVGADAPRAIRWCKQIAMTLTGAILIVLGVIWFVVALTLRAVGSIAKGTLEPFDTSYFRSESRPMFEKQARLAPFGKQMMHQWLPLPLVLIALGLTLTLIGVT